MKKTKTKIGILLMLLMAIFALAIYAEEQDTLDKAKFQVAVPYNQAVEIHFGAKTKMPTEYTQDKGDVSEAQNGKIHAYAADDGKYYIAHEEDKTIYFPEDSSYLFSDFDIEKPKEYTKLTSITFDHIDTSNVTSMDGMFEGCQALRTLDLSSFDTSKVIEMGHMFNGCFDLTELDLSSFDTSEVRNMEWMFAGCHALKTLDLSNFNTSNVTRMGSIFYVCKTLTELDLSSFDTNNVIDMQYMFDGCEALKKLNLSSFRTRNVKYMSGMFMGCNVLETLDVSNFNTRNVIDMQYMFKECNALKELDVSNFNTSKVTRMQYMFYGCNGLKELDLSSFDTSDVTDMSVMFAGCNGLKKLDLSKFNTVNVTDMSGMFNRCHALEKLDLSSFDTSKVTDMGHMFSECTNLTTIYASENFNTDSITMIEADKDMFKECKSLVGGKGTGYVEGNTDKEYARIDGGVDAPGYFTEKGSTSPSVVTDTLDKDKFHKEVPSAQAVEIHFGAKGSMDANKYTQYKGDVSVAQNGKIHAYANDKGTKYYIAHEKDGIIYFPKDSGYLFSDKEYSKNYAKLKSITFNNIDTSNVTSMRTMFRGCNVLEELDVSNFNTNNVTGMGYMFVGCFALKELDLSSFNTSNVTDMRQMFIGCESLEILDLSSFDTSNVTDMSGMFEECTKLKTIYASENFKIDNVTIIDNGEDMFQDCTQLVGGKGTKYDKKHVGKEYARIDGGTSAPGYFTEKGSTPPSVVTDTLDKNKFHKAVPCAQAVEIHFGAKTKMSVEYTQDKGDVSVAQNGKIRAYATEDGKKYYIAHEDNKTIYFPKDSEYLFSDEKTVQHYTKLNKITFNDHIDTSDVVNMAGMFYGCESLETLDVSKFNTSNVVNMAAIFNGCKSLKTLDVSEFNTGNVANMVGMFKECKALTSITFNDHIDTSNVTNMANMFEGCSALKELDVSKFNTSEVTRMDDMFNGCKALKELKLSSFNTSNVTDMKGMFKECKALTSITFNDNIDTSEVTRMDDMFNGCKSLTTLDVSKFNTSNVTDMKYMFAGCEALTTLDVSKFDTSNATDMESMFWSCQALTELDLSSFNTSKVADMKYMFLGCIKLKTIYVSENFNTDNIKMIEAGKDVFKHCTQLKGGKGTKYNASHTGKEYARIDGGKDAPGYFTKKGSTLPLPKKYNITTSIDGKGTATATPNSAVEGTEITIEAIAKPNYKFVKWEGINGLKLTVGNTNTAVVKFTMPDKDVTVKAIFEPIPSTHHTISFDRNGGSGSMTAVTVGHGKNYTLPKCDFAAPEGKEFDHWEVKGIVYNVGDKITDIKDDLTIKAVWKKKSSGGSSGGGSSSGSSKKTDNTVKQEQPSSQTPQPSSDNNLAENPAKNNIIKKQQTTVFTIGSNIMTVMEDGKSKQTTIDAKSFLSQGRTMIPVRYVAESMGMKVEWDKKTMTVILKNKEMTVKIPVKTDKIIVIKADGTKQEYTSDVKPIVKNGRTYLPISNIAKVLDLKPGEGIKWDNNTKQVTIVKQIDIH